VSYEPTEGVSIVSQAGDTVLLRCALETASRKIWTLRCVDDEWVINDGQPINCTSTGQSKPMLQNEDSDSVAAAAGGVPGRLLCLADRRHDTIRYDTIRYEMLF